MFSLHVLLFSLLGASVARLDSPVLSDEEISHLLQHARNIAFTHGSPEILYRLPPLERAHEEMHDLNNVIQINGAGQIRLCELRDDNIPGKIRCFGLIQPKSLLQRLTGIWRWMPNADDYHRRLEYLIVTPAGHVETIMWHPSEPEIESQILLYPQSRPQTPLSQISTDTGHGDGGFPQRMVGFWYCSEKCAHPSYVVNLQPNRSRFFYKLGASAGQMTQIEVASQSEQELLLVGLWFRMPQALTQAPLRHDQLSIAILDGELAFRLESFE
ncbi:hypothetical protein AX14_000928 [Amanita brunnescens Koide BX004]|nr:hypothetical protein AX14_000928 [Amanita brunnescens Koide BX004]